MHSKSRIGANHLVKLGVLHEISGKKRDKVYVYKKYLSLLKEGTEPLK